MGAVLKLASAQNRGKRLAARLINALGENVSKGYIVNTPERMALLRQNAFVAKSIERIREKAKDSRAEKKKKKSDNIETMRKRELPLVAQMESNGVSVLKTKEGKLTYKSLQNLNAKLKKEFPEGAWFLFVFLLLSLFRIFVYLHCVCSLLGMKKNRDNLVTLLLGEAMPVAQQARERNRRRNRRRTWKKI